MSVSLKTQKILWGKAAGRCAMPTCRRQLVEDISETDDPTLVGENCHIVGARLDGPRGDSTLSAEDRDKYANLILMCNVDHKIIDDNTGVWTVERLKDTKAEHEKWVVDSLGLDQIKVRDDTVYADYIDEWLRLAHVVDWTAWSSHVLGSGQPTISVIVHDDLTTLRRWLLGRIWPGRYPDLENAFANFGRVLADFLNKFSEHSEPRGAHQLTTEKFYRISEWNEERYNRLAEQYDFHVDIVSDLMVELTRAGNLLCDKVRRRIAHNFRLAEGHLIVQRGPDINLSWVEFVPRYSLAEATTEGPYVDLDHFYDERRMRDWSIGSGPPPW